MGEVCLLIIRDVSLLESRFNNKLDNFVSHTRDPSHGGGCTGDFLGSVFSDLCLSSTSTPFLPVTQDKGVGPSGNLVHFGMQKIVDLMAAKLWALQYRLHLLSQGPVFHPA